MVSQVESAARSLFDEPVWQSGEQSFRASAESLGLSQLPGLGPAESLKDPLLGPGRRRVSLQIRPVLVRA